ncbi:MAG: tetratricopeptide repeat protein, partial [Candidatus Omnitrophica bacterium]|nr:tetratricopeptide repeat protein [Candidatus Omnitrophota bacterium]
MRSPSKILVLTLVLQLGLPLNAFFQGATLVYAQELPEEDPSFKERKVKEGFTLDLKELIERSKKKIEQVDDKLKDQAQERRNQQREAKAREYFEKAQSLYDQGEFDKARELWEKAIKITEHDEMSNY